MNVIDQRPRKPSKAAVRLGFVILGIVILGILGLASVGPYTDYLWYLEDGRHPQVFSILYETRSTLFVVGFAVALVVLYFNLSRALKISLVYLDKPSTVGEVMVTKALTVIQDRGQLITKVFSLVAAFLFGSAFSAQWQTYLLAIHAQPFHKPDPIFGIDLGYFVFTLPWQMEILSFVFGLVAVTTILTTAIYVGLQAIAAIGRIELGRGSVRTHLSVLLGILIILMGVRLWMDRYQYGSIQSDQFVGAGYAAMHRLLIQGPVAGLVAAVGLLIVFTPVISKGWKVAGYGLVAGILAYFLGLVVYPGVLQSLQVTPNRIALESPYATKAIDMTRFSYGLDQIEEKNATVEDQPTPADLTASKTTLDNMRLWDPSLLMQSAEALQGLKPYYRFHDVDIDRYPIGGKEQMVMVAPRDIELSGLSSSAQSWINLHVEYTHGFGIAMSPVNAADPSGQPEFIVRDIPPVSPPELPVTQPRIYYSDYRFSDQPPTYSLVDARTPEFDYPSETGDQQTRWSGDRGIQIGSFWTRLAFSVEMSDFSLLVSSNVTANTRLLMHLSVLDRAQLLYPFLSFDSDPYIVLYQGRLLWILDGYTKTDQMPYSAYTSTPMGDLNYVRNPVKLVVDAYTGEVDCYAIQPDEPVLKAYEAIYPGLVKDRSQIPAGLEAHFRYPEDMFTAQARQLTQYHVTDPKAFLENEDAWDMPTERGLSGGEEYMQPYYVQMRLPADPKDEFLLILPFTPRAKGNMSGWLAAHCDPDRYGRLWLYEYPRGSILPGPKQMEAYFNQNAAIAYQNTLLRNEQSKVLVGNLLVMPIGNSVMYAEPMFLESNSPGITAIPELKKVVLALKDKVVVADTYAEALQELFGNLASPGVPAPSTEAVSTPGVSAPAAKAPLGSVPKAQIQSLLQIANEADAALKAGDFAKYGDLQKQLRAGLEKLAK